MRSSRMRSSNILEVLVNHNWIEKKAILVSLALSASLAFDGQPLLFGSLTNANAQGFRRYGPGLSGS